MVPDTILDKIIAPLNSSQPQIIFEDEFLLALYKPSSWFVHPPEDPRYRAGIGRRTCVHWLLDHHNLKGYPAHRLDAATEGVMIFGKTKSAVSHLNLQFKEHKVSKTYTAITRGWFKETEGKIDLELELDSTGTKVPCLTLYRTLAQLELPIPVNSRFNTSRYSWIELHPATGRWHQLRRHLNRVSHPIIGDREHGDSHHNRFFRENLNINGLCLAAVQIKLQHPNTNQEICFKSPLSDRWLKLQSLFQPFLNQSKNAAICFSNPAVDGS